MRKVVLILSLTGLVACTGEFAPVDPAPLVDGGGGGGDDAGDIGPLNFTDDIGPLFQARCSLAGCHDDASRSANYATTSYAEVLGGGLDATPNVIPGDADSVLVTKLSSPHYGVEVSEPNIGEMLHAWVVDDNAAETP